MRVAFVTTYDPDDPYSFSGTSRRMSKALEDQGIELRYIGNLREELGALWRAKRIAYRGLWRKSYLPDREPRLLKAYSRQVAGRLEGLDADVVMSPGSLPVAYLECPQPIVFWTDATFAGMVDFYPYFSDLCASSLRDGNTVERASLERCALALYSSDWAALSAIDAYGTDPSKVKVVPFGSDLPLETPPDDVERTVDGRASGRCRLLFIAVDWDRKRGDLVVDIAGALNRAGLPTELDVVGCAPPDGTLLPDFVTLYGFIDRSKEEGARHLARLYARSHFLVVPSIADCTPIVFNEACSFALPCLSTEVGGVPSMIRDGRNGRLFPVEAGPQAYRDYIVSALSEPMLYRELALSSYKEYRARMNWDVAGAAVRDLMEGLL